MIPITSEADPVPPPPASFSPNGPTLLQRLEAEIERARPGLAAESEESRAAVLLLLAREGGLNVERLTARTRYPRDFVARCVRRLVDNGWLGGGGVRCEWAAEGAACRPFWADVEVALGRMLRRTGEDGRLEWMPVGGWVKHFEYSAPPAREGEVGNHYREIPAYDPEPEAPPSSTGEDVAADTVDPARERPRPRIAPPSAQLPRVRRLEVERPAAAPRPLSPPGGMLVDGWGTAEWLG